MQVTFSPSVFGVAPQSFTINNCGDTCLARRAALEHMAKQGIKAYGLNFDSSDLSYAKLDGLVAERCSFANLPMDHASLRGASLIDCDLNGVSLSSADLSGATLQVCSLFGACAQDAKVVGSALIGCNLRGANLSRVRAEESTWTSCRTAGSQWVDAVMTWSSVLGLEGHEAHIEAFAGDYADHEALRLFNRLLQGSPEARAAARVEAERLRDTLRATEAA
jgi:uncharacterized protein YjbI with pentapeptide repeats